MVLHPFSHPSEKYLIFDMLNVFFNDIVNFEISFLDQVVMIWQSEILFILQFVLANEGVPDRFSI